MFCAAPVSQSLPHRRAESTTYLWRGLVAQDLLDLLEYLGRELRDNLERAQVVDDLLRLRRAEDDRARVRVRRDPRERELAHAAPELCVPRQYRP